MAGKLGGLQHSLTAKHGGADEEQAIQGPVHRWGPVTVALLAAMAFAWTLGAHSAQPVPDEAASSADEPVRVSNAERCPEQGLLIAKVMCMTHAC